MVKPTLSLIVVTYKNEVGLVHNLQSIARQTASQIETIVVDNGASGNITAIVDSVGLRSCRTIRVARNVFICGAVNAGARVAHGRYLAVLNDDVELDPSWAEVVLNAIESSPTHIKSIAPLVAQAEDKNLIDSAGVYIDVSGRATNVGYGRPIETASEYCKQVIGPSSACAVYDRNAFFQCGGLDERFGGYFEDVDLGMRMHLMAYGCRLVPAARALHVGGATLGRSAMTAYLMERNSVWNLVKNFPDELWRKYRWEILHAMRQPLPLTTGPPSWRSWARGKFASSIGMAAMRLSRQGIQASRRASVQSLEELLTIAPVISCRL